MTKTITINGIEYELNNDKVRRIVEGIEEAIRHQAIYEKKLPYFVGTSEEATIKADIENCKNHIVKLQSWLA